MVFPTATFSSALAGPKKTNAAEYKDNGGISDRDSRLSYAFANTPGDGRRNIRNYCGSHFWSNGNIKQIQFGLMFPRFTGKERDTETGLDYFLFRNYSGSEGRFTSPDPDNFGAHATNPQSWNGYSYGLNSPLRYVDPLGLAPTDCNLNGVNVLCGVVETWLQGGATEMIARISNDTSLSYYDGNQFLFLFAGAEALAYVGFQHLATLTEWNGKFYTKDGMDSIISERVESQKTVGQIIF